jgi:hypothetical protein
MGHVAIFLYKMQGQQGPVGPLSVLTQTLFFPGMRYVYPYLDETPDHIPHIMHTSCNFRNLPPLLLKFCWISASPPSYMSAVNLFKSCMPLMYPQCWTRCHLKMGGKTKLNLCMLLFLYKAVQAQAVFNQFLIEILTMPFASVPRFGSRTSLAMEYAH